MDGTKQEKTVTTISAYVFTVTTFLHQKKQVPNIQIRAEQARQSVHYVVCGGPLTSL